MTHNTQTQKWRDSIDELATTLETHVPKTQWQLFYVGDATQLGELQLLLYARFGIHSVWIPDVSRIVYPASLQISVSRPNAVEAGDISVCTDTGYLNTRRLSPTDE